MASVLLVDDELAIRRTLSRWLAMRGFEVECASNGRDALQLAQEVDFDVVVSDVNMPVMGGVDLLRALHTVLPELPVVLMSGSAEIPSREDALARGAFEYLAKPMDLRVLEATVTSAIHARNRPRNRARST